MTDSSLAALTRRARFYSEAVAAEQWKRDHNEAEGCYRLEMHLALGLRLFDLFEECEREWKEGVASGDIKPTKKDIELINGLWERWNAPCEHVEQIVEHFEKLGYEVDRADDFRFCCAIADRRDPSDLCDVAEIRVALDDPKTFSHDEVKRRLGLDA